MTVNLYFTFLGNTVHSSLQSKGDMPITRVYSQAQKFVCTRPHSSKSSTRSVILRHCVLSVLELIFSSRRRGSATRLWQAERWSHWWQSYHARQAADTNDKAIAFTYSIHHSSRPQSALDQFDQIEITPGFRRSHWWRLRCRGSYIQYPRHSLPFWGYKSQEQSLFQLPSVTASEHSLRRSTHLSG